MFDRSFLDSVSTSTFAPFTEDPILSISALLVQRAVSNVDGVLFHSMINTGALGFLRRRKRKPFAQVFKDPAIFAKRSSTGLRSTYERYLIIIPYSAI